MLQIKHTPRKKEREKIMKKKVPVDFAYYIYIYEGKCELFLNTPGLLFP